jgi:4-amino-4-deoxy-L-arabinose transferase-like glycosyltransferase
MRVERLSLVAWSAVILVTVLRFAFAQSLPLTGDEAYYWEWSRRLAAGYADHPPAVAFAIAAFASLGHTPLGVRFAFVLFGLGTALAAAGAANALARDRRAGAIAALAVTLAPIMSVLFGIATPDGPYAFTWACSLYCAARAFTEQRMRWFVLLGLALGEALLSRFFAWAVFAGVAAAALSPQYRALWRQGLWLSFGIAIACYVPFLLWNASHDWISFRFALLQRHPSEIAPLRPLTTYLLNALAFSPGLWIAATIAIARPKYALLTWTALPLTILLFVVAFHERVEVYWFTGPYISLSVVVGCAYAQWNERRRRAAAAWIFVPAAALSALLFAAGIAPREMYAALVHAGLHLSDSGPFEMFTYRPLATDVRRLIHRRGAIAMTDGYGFSSLLDFYGGLDPVVIGYDAQGEEARHWFTESNRPQRALFVDKVPLASRPDFTRQLARACGEVTPGPTLDYRYRRYFTTWCNRMAPDAVAILRWQMGKD